MKRYLLLITLFVAHFATADIEQVNTNRFAELIESPDTLLIDFRTPGEIAQGKIPNALEIDFTAKDIAAKLADLPKDKTLLLYCRSGNRSGQAAKRLDALGYPKLVNLEGGIIAWQKANLPVVTPKLEKP